MPSEAAELILDDPDAGTLTFDARVSGPDDGEPVLLLHGWPQGARSWDDVTPVLNAAGYRCAAVEQRGYSPGARPAGTANYAIDRLVADAVGFTEALGWERPHVVGHDWGAVVAWVLAATRPGLVRSLTALSIPHPAALIRAARAEEEQRNRLAYMEVLRAPGGVAERVLLDDDAAKLRLVYAGLVPEHVVDAYVANLTEPGAMTAVLEWYRAMDTDGWAALPRVEVATTYVWGEQDIAVGRGAAETCGEWVEADYAFVPLAGAGHWLPEERPADVAAAILERVRDAVA